MSDQDWSKTTPDEVLDFWFPDDGHWEQPQTHVAFWMHRMQGGVDAEICERFGPLTEAAARGQLDHWAATPRGRLGLVIALDQFPRSHWRDTPGAYGQDIKSANLACAALDNGDWAALPNVWEKQFMIIAIGHAEGPEHKERMERCLPLAMTLIDEAPPQLKDFYLIGADQCLIGIETMTRFGRHPHRNEILGRVSTPDEAAYIAIGKFPHQRTLPDDPEGFAAELDRIRDRLAPHLAT